MKIMSVVGARPNFMKIAPIADAIREHNRADPLSIDHLIVHTGQHYDEKMSASFFDELEIPKPHLNLEVGSGSHSFQTAECMRRLEPILLDVRPDFILLVGDVNSTIAGALVAAKLGIKIIHVEAGLRSFDRSMPEEINRVLTDAISDMLFITERDAEVNLIREGIAREKIHFVGNVMIDTLLKHRRRAERTDVLEKVGVLPEGYIVLTLHRPSNVDDPGVLRVILEALQEISRQVPIVFPVHPRTRSKIAELHFTLEGGIKVVDPLGYLEFLKLMTHARLVMTDSGGIQEETTVLGIPCLTLRKNTERPITVTQGTNNLAPLDRRSIVGLVLEIAKKGRRQAKIPERWDGMAAKRMVNCILGRCACD